MASYCGQILEIAGVYVNVIELSAELYRQYPQKYAKYVLARTGRFGRR
jgi:hypothetical protein